MEVVIYIALIYGGLFFVGWVFEQIGKWNEERKSNIRDEVAREIIPNTDISSEMIEDYKEKLKIIGYNGDQNYEWLASYYRSKEKKSYRGLLGKCPSCDNGYLRVVTGKYGKFIGCSAYPKCHYTKNLDVAKNEYKEKVGKEFINLFHLAYQ